MATMPQLPTGHLVTDDDWNAHADQINANTTAIASASGTLTSYGTRLSALESPATVVLRKNADQAIPTGSDTLITWQTEVHDPGNLAASNRITIGTAGVYLVVAQLNVQPQQNTNATQRVMYIRKNGGFVGDTSVGVLAQPGVSGGSTQQGAGNGMMTGTIAKFAAGDYIEVLLWQDSGISLNVRPNSFGGSSFSLTRIL